MTHCLFCEIAEKKGKAEIIYEDDEFLAFEDIHPQAPVHFLVIPKKHIETLLDTDEATMGKMLSIATRLAEKKDLAANGFRTVINCKRHGGQSVYHLHVHVMGGRWFTWPPG